MGVEAGEGILKQVSDGQGLEWRNELFSIKWISADRRRGNGSICEAQTVPPWTPSLPLSTELLFTMQLGSVDLAKSGTCICPNPLLCGF